MKKQIFYWLPKILATVIGVFFIISGEHDDSPGLQGIGLILLVATFISVYRNSRIRK